MFHFKFWRALTVPEEKVQMNYFLMNGWKDRCLSCYLKGNYILVIVSVNVSSSLCKEGIGVIFVIDA